MSIISNIEKERTFRFRKDPIKAKKDELITMLETVNRVIKDQKVHQNYHS